MAKVKSFFNVCTITGILPTHYPHTFAKQEQFTSILAETSTSQEESMVLQLDTIDIYIHNMTDPILKIVHQKLL